LSIQPDKQKQTSTHQIQIHFWAKYSVREIGGHHHHSGMSETQEKQMRPIVFRLFCPSHKVEQ
jgi:hypothetical protein